MNFLEWGIEVNKLRRFIVKGPLYTYSDYTLDIFLSIWF